MTKRFTAAEFLEAIQEMQAARDAWSGLTTIPTLEAAQDRTLAALRYALATLEGIAAFRAWLDKEAREWRESSISPNVSDSFKLKARHYADQATLALAELDRLVPLAESAQKEPTT